MENGQSDQRRKRKLTNDSLRQSNGDDRSSGQRARVLKVKKSQLF